MTESQYAGLNKDPKEITLMFDSLASRYDATDALMTGGLNRVWMTAPRKAVAPYPGGRILDLATGTGASSVTLAKSGAEVVACDLSEGTIEVGCERHPEIEFVHDSAMDLNFEDSSFNTVTISWGLCNISDPELVLREMARAMHPRGRLVVLEFSTPSSHVFCGIYSTYQLIVMLVIARLVSTDDDTYDHLIESIRAWPTQEELSHIIAANSWSEVEYRNLTGGITCMHHTVKPLP